MKTLFIFALVLFLVSCSTGFDRGALKQRLADQVYEVTDEDIKKALAVKPQIKFPIRLAVYLVQEEERRPYYRNPEWRWTAEDKEKLIAALESLKEDGIISTAFVMSGFVTSEVVQSGSDLKGIRLAAAKHGSEVVLVLKGAVQVDSYVNGLAVFNLLILPGFVVPASHRDALFMMEGAMWDVGNEYLYVGAETEGIEKVKGPSFTIDEEEAIKKAKSNALEDISKELKRRLKSLKGV